MTTLVRHISDTDVFDQTREALLASDIHAGMARLRATLCGLRSELPSEHWKAVGERVRQHPLHQLLLESPFTHRGYAKPRGYAGDAGLMDLIYGAPPEQRPSPLGAMLYAFEFDSPCFHSVRTRRAVLAREIDDVAAMRPEARVLSVACGHLREVEWSRAVHQGAVSITAVDQDENSVASVREAYRDLDVRPVLATVRDLIRRPAWIGELDLAYAAGLYDYLEDNVARLLTTALFTMLRPGGRLLLANFTPATRDAAFMEAVMDWHLIYRTPDEVRAIASGIPADAIDRIDQFSDGNGQIAYMRVVKR